MKLGRRIKKTRVRIWLYDFRARRRELYDAATTTTFVKFSFASEPGFEKTGAPRGPQRPPEAPRGPQRPPEVPSEGERETKREEGEGRGSLRNGRGGDRNRARGSARGQGRREIMCSLSLHVVPRGSRDRDRRGGANNNNNNNNNQSHATRLASWSLPPAQNRGASPEVE